LPLGDSSKVKTGQHVTALGYPASFENPERQRVVDDRLSDVEDAHACPRKNPGECVRDAGAVAAGDVDVKDSGLGLSGHGNMKL